MAIIWHIYRYMCHVAIYVQPNINKYVWLSANLIPPLVTTEHSLAPKNVTSTLGWHCSGIFWGGSSDTSLCHVYIFCQLVFRFSFIFCSTQWWETHLSQLSQTLEGIRMWSHQCLMMAAMAHLPLQHPIILPSSSFVLLSICFDSNDYKEQKKWLFKPLFTLNWKKKWVAVLASFTFSSQVHKERFQGFSSHDLTFRIVHLDMSVMWHYTFIAAL